MTTLKEIAALFRLYVDEIAKVRIDQIEQHPYLPEAEEAADQLEALAGAEPKSTSPEVVLSAPERIWLQVSDDETHIAETFPATDEGVTWCRDSVLSCEVEYVRADLAAPQRIAVSREALRIAMMQHANAEAALRALGIELRDEG